MPVGTDDCQSGLTNVSHSTLATAYSRYTAESPEPGAGSPWYTPPDMNGKAPDASADPGDRSRTGTYVAVILLEALVVAGLYLFGRYFSA